MSYANNTFGEPLTFAAQASADARADFIGKTYLHLGGAVLVFAAITAALMGTPFAVTLTNLVWGTQYGYLVFFALFMGVSWLAESWARSSTNQGTQYLGLGLYVLAQSVFFVPLLMIAQTVGSDVIPTAAVLTLVVFAGLTVIVWFTRYNFSFLGPGLSVAGLAILGVFLCSFVFGYNLGSLGVWLPAGLVVFAGLYILYHTSNVLHEYQIGQHVAASLALFASVALLFWYMIQLVMRARD